MIKNRLSQKAAEKLINNLGDRNKNYRCGYIDCLLDERKICSIVHEYLLNKFVWSENEEKNS